MRLHDAQKIVNVLNDASVNAWVQLTIDADEYSVNFIIDRKLYNINEHIQELFS